jgi:ribosome recycling factor
LDPLFLEPAKLEQDFITILQMIDETISSRTENLKLLNEQTNAIQLEIKGVRKALNEHLDNLEKKILDDLNTAAQRHSIDIAQIVFDEHLRQWNYTAIPDATTL